MTTCRWTTPSGLTCDAEALTSDPDEKCWFHSETNEEARAEARRRGGKASRAIQRPTGIAIDVSSAEAILESLRAVGQALADGRADRSTANSLSYILSTATQATKLVGHERRIKRLEVKLGLRDPAPEGGDG